MTDSDQPSIASSKLMLHVRRMETLWSAWYSVRSRAMHSPHQGTRAAAELINDNPQAALRKIHEQLRNETFVFQPQRAVLKARKGKDPRPIVVAPVVNRIVQRAILETLQSKKIAHRAQLREIQDIVRTPTSVGGLPERGAPDAVRLIRASISSGATHFVRSDIKDFFRGIKTADLLLSISRKTNDAAFTKLMGDGLAVELSNIDDPGVRQWLSLFPDGEIGVAQGSSLASFMANYALADFDAALNEGNIVTVRYIDDFLILAPNEKAARKAWRAAQRILQSMDLEAHEPTPTSKKASLGLVASGFDFLSYRFDSANVSVSRDAKAKLIAAIKAALASARRDIQTTLRASRRAEPRLAQTLVSIDRRIRGWGDAFSDTTLRVEFSQLDREINDEIRSFLSWYSATVRQHDEQVKQRALGVALLSDTPRARSQPGE